MDKLLENLKLLLSDPDILEEGLVWNLSKNADGVPGYRLVITTGDGASFALSSEYRSDTLEGLVEDLANDSEYGYNED